MKLLHLSQRALRKSTHLQPRCPHLQSPAAWRQGHCYTHSRKSCSWPVRSLATEAAQAHKPEGALRAGSLQQSWNVRMLFDGDCPLCMREVNMLRRRDEGKGRIDFVNIGDPDYSPADNAGISYEQAMGNIHAITREGDVITNVEVFKRLYEQVGLGWVYAFASVKPLRYVADRVYNFWARYRLPLTRRPDMATILAEKRTCKGSS